MSEYPKIHNSVWPGLVGKEPDTDHPPISLDKMLELTASAEVNGTKFDGFDIFLFSPHFDFDVIDTMKQYRVNLAPLRFGAGLKGKVIDGFVSGTATVASPIAVEGILDEHDWGCPVSADAEKFAEASVAIYKSNEKWEQMQKQGREIASARFSPAEWKPCLMEYLNHAMERRNEYRHQHFYGRLLRHHQHRSTEFMSRWIEEKNR